MDNLESVIHLIDEHGDPSDFEFLDLVNYKGEEYVVLLPCSIGADEVGEVVILQVSENNYEDFESYVSVDDSETLNAVFQVFKDRFKNDFSFLDE